MHLLEYQSCGLSGHLARIFLLLEFGLYYGDTWQGKNAVIQILEGVVLHEPILYYTVGNVIKVIGLNRIRF